MKDRRERVDITKVDDELTRRELLGEPRWDPSSSSTGRAGKDGRRWGAEIPTQGARRNAPHHPVESLRAAYDKWFDNVYVKRWGQANDTEVRVDHVNLAELPSRAASEVAAQSGHDLFQFLSPPAATRIA